MLPYRQSKNHRIQKEREKRAQLAHALLSYFLGKDVVPLRSVRAHTMQWLDRNRRELTAFPQNIKKICARIHSKSSNRVVLSLLRRIAKLYGFILISERRVKRQESKIVSIYSYKLLKVPLQR